MNDYMEKLVDKIREALSMIRVNTWVPALVFAVNNCIDIQHNTRACSTLMAIHDTTVSYLSYDNIDGFPSTISPTMQQELDTLSTTVQSRCHTNAGLMCVAQIADSFVKFQFDPKAATALSAVLQSSFAMIRAE